MQYQSGFKSPNKILSEADEDAIKTEWLEGDWKTSHKFIGDKYGVNATTIARAIQRSLDRQGERTAKRLGMG